jgi:pSer/pThr/pTyr-binding forkhead associated (FHA) protein
MARLKIQAPDGVREVVLGERLTIGRVEGVDLVLDDKGISRKHCEVVKSAESWLLRDLGSSNGSFVNGQKVTERALRDGDQIRLGALSLTFHQSDADFALRFTAGEHAGREVPLTSARTTLGRRPDNVIPFVDVKISGVHLEVVKEGEGFVLRDLGSTNGTFLDGKKVTEVALSHGDRVKLGDSEFTFADLREGETDAVSAAVPERLSAQLPPKRGRTAAVLGLVGVTLAVAAAAVWYFGFAQDGSAEGSGKGAPPPPAGTLLAEDWSFEDSASAAALWTAELGSGFGVRRGAAVTGGSAMAARIETGHAVSSVRQAEEIPPARALEFSGQLRADGNALVSAGLRFLRAADDPAQPAHLTIVAGRAIGAAAFAAFEARITPPAWAKRAEVVLVARGEGEAMADDLALVPGSVIPASRSGEIELLPRGAGAFVVDYRAPLAELFIPFGSGTVAAGEDGEAPTRVELPPGAFAADVTGGGARLGLKPGSGRFAAEGFAALGSPELAAAGVTLFTGAGSEHRYGAFDAQGVTKLLLGSAAERFELSLSGPTRVAAVTRGDALELRLFTPDELAVSWRAGFEAERKEAGELLAKAQEAWRSGRGGEALAKLKELRDRVPHDEKALALARQLDAEIVAKLREELEAIEADAAEAEFLGSLERTRRTLARAKALLAQAEGLEAARDLAVRVAGMEASVAAMERERREREARRLLRLARAYAAQKAPAPERGLTAAELLEELQRSYAETAAAREARGEAAGGGGS